MEQRQGVLAAVDAVEEGLDALVAQVLVRRLVHLGWVGHELRREGEAAAPPVEARVERVPR